VHLGADEFLLESLDIAQSLPEGLKEGEDLVYNIFKRIDDGKKDALEINREIGTRNSHHTEGYGKKEKENQYPAVSIEEDAVHLCIKPPDWKSEFAAQYLPR
jgi:hypothetical protein